MVERVGVIGLGNIGNGVAKNYAKSRWPVIVWDKDPDKRRPFETMHNVTVAPPAEMARECTVIIFLVPSHSQICECTGGKKGIFANAQDKLVLLDLTSSDPRETQRISREAARRKISYIDAGTSGGPIRADSGELLLMVGGDKAAFARSRKYMNVIAKDIYYLGPSGAGHTLKLIHNNLCYTIFLATCEAGRQAETAGIGISDMIYIFNKSNARSYASEERFPRHILTKKWDGRGMIGLLYKDLILGVKLCRRMGANANLTHATLSFVERAIDAGMAEMDYTLLYRDYEKIWRAQRTRANRSH